MEKSEVFIPWEVRVRSTTEYIPCLCVSEIQAISDPDSYLC